MNLAIIITDTEIFLFLFWIAIMYGVYKIGQIFTELMP
jgi:hypothetical protein